MTDPIRLVLADDQELVRLGFRMVLDAQADMTVVAEVGNGQDAVRAASAPAGCDVVLMDIRMPIMDGVEATRRIVASGAPAKVLVLTTFDLDEYVYSALQAGASGRSRTAAATCSPQCASGMPKTATSATASCFMSAVSTWAG